MNLQLYAVNDTDKTLVVSVDGIKYEYWFQGDFPKVVRIVRGPLYYKAPGKALAWIKQRAVRCDRIDGVVA